MKYGRTSDDDVQVKEFSKERTMEFIDKFKERNGTILCSELIYFEVSTQENKELAIEKCSQFIRDSAEFLEEILSNF